MSSVIFLLAASLAGFILQFAKLRVNLDSQQAVLFAIILSFAFVILVVIPPLFIAYQRILHPNDFPPVLFFQGLFAIVFVCFVQSVFSITAQDEFRMSVVKFGGRLSEMIGELTLMLLTDILAFVWMVLVLFSSAFAMIFFLTPYSVFYGNLSLLGMWPLAGVLLLVPVVLWNLVCYFLIPFLYQRIWLKKIFVRPIFKVACGLLIIFWIYTFSSNIF